MSSSLPLPLLISFLPLLLSSLTHVIADIPVNATVPPSTACNVATNPSFCKSVLPQHSRSNLYGYGKYLVKKSIGQSTQFSKLVHRTLSDNDSSPFSPLAEGALKDCLELSQLTTEFLITSLSTLNANGTANLQTLQGDKVQTLLSAIVTNQQTCYDGLVQASFLQKGDSLYAPLVNGSQLYKVSLALVAHSWVPKNRTKHQGTNSTQGPSLRARKLLDELRVSHRDNMPSWVNRKMFKFHRRHLLDTSEGAIPITSLVTVSQTGTSDFTDISAAVSAAPDNVDASKGYYVIYVTAGVYQEYVTIAKSKKNIMLIGDGINQTIITGNRSVGDGWTTFNSGTLAVIGQNFVAMDITVQNTAGPRKGQAVAVRNGADLSTFYHCSIEGYQDTLYTHSLRQFYRECDIYGTVDFIFGNAAVVFQNCNLYARLPTIGQGNVLTAQGRSDPNQNTGTSIINCSILATPDLQANLDKVRSYLGRPWKQYSRTVYIQSFIDGLIDPSGWSIWTGDFALSTLYYGEYKNTGPGSELSQRVTWPGYHSMMNVTKDVANFTVDNFVQGDVWLPNNAVPFFIGLAS